MSHIFNIVFQSSNEHFKIFREEVTAAEHLLIQVYLSNSLELSWNTKKLNVLPKIGTDLLISLLHFRQDLQLRQ